MAEFVKVCKTSDIPVGSGRTVDVKGTSVAVFNVDGAFHAINDTCMHRGGPLGEGEVDGKIVICPWHGWRFDVTTGTNEFNPSLAVEKYEVKIEGDDLWVETRTTTPS
jgi:nitrite reductase/ring-hydroxylating ferredoxin subunit